MSKQAKENYLVMVADDSDADRFLLRQAMDRAARLQIIAELKNGSEVIAYLEGRAEFEDRGLFPLPDLLLLDLKMPRKDGFDVLEWLRKRAYHDLTVVVLTDSMNPEHIKRALDLGADLFQLKPKAGHDREAMILALEEYLLKSVPITLPQLPLPAVAA